jgi:hypothetical protein
MKAVGGRSTRSAQTPRLLRSIGALSVGVRYSDTSGGLRILMKQPIEPISSHDPPSRHDDRWLIRPKRRRRPQGAVRTVALVVVGVLTKEIAKRWTRQSAFAQVNQRAEVWLLPHSLVACDLTRGRAEVAAGGAARRRPRTDHPRGRPLPVQSYCDLADGAFALLRLPGTSGGCKAARWQGHQPMGTCGGGTAESAGRAGGW